MIENEEDIYTKLDPTMLELENMNMISFGVGTSQVGFTLTN